MLFSQRDKYSLNETFPVLFWMNTGKFHWGWWSLVDSHPKKTRVFSRQVNYNNLLTSSHRFPPVLRYGHVGYVKHGGGKVWLDAVPRRSGLPQHVGVIPKILWRSHKICFPSQVGLVSRNRVLNFSVNPAIHCHQPEGLGLVNPSNIAGTPCKSTNMKPKMVPLAVCLFKGDSNKSIGFRHKKLSSCLNKTFGAAATKSHKHLEPLDDPLLEIGRDLVSSPKMGDPSYTYRTPKFLGDFGRQLGEWRTRYVRLG